MDERHLVKQIKIISTIFLIFLDLINHKVDVK